MQILCQVERMVREEGAFLATQTTVVALPPAVPPPAAEVGL